MILIMVMAYKESVNLHFDICEECGNEEGLRMYKSYIDRLKGMAVPIDDYYEQKSDPKYIEAMSLLSPEQLLREENSKMTCDIIFTGDGLQRSETLMVDEEPFRVVFAKELAQSRMRDMKDCMEVSQYHDASVTFDCQVISKGRGIDGANDRRIAKSNSRMIEESKSRGVVGDMGDAPRESRFSFRIAGLSYHVDNNPDECGTFDGYLKPEPTNRYDENAVMVCVEGRQKNTLAKIVGYVPRTKAPLLKELVAPKWPCKIRIYDSVAEDGKEWMSEDEMKDFCMLEGQCTVEGLGISQEDYDAYGKRGR